MLAGDYKNKEGVTIRIDGKGPLGVIHVDAFNSNRVRGYVDTPVVDLPLKPNGKLDVSGAVGTDGEVTVTRFTPEKTTYTSRSPIVSGEIAEDLAYYLYTSEQVPSTINLGVLVIAIIQLPLRRVSGSSLARSVRQCVSQSRRKYKEDWPDYDLANRTS